MSWRGAEDCPSSPTGEKPGASGRQPTCLDLFCGCGGFSLGMERAGFKVLAAIDFNPEAIATFKANFSKDTLALHKDLTRFPPDKLAAKLGVNQVDVIVGGPPCQGYSTVRQVDAANHGSRVKRDKRRYLFRVYLDYVAAFRPRVFVMENVLGLQSAAKGKFFTLVQSEARKLGYRVQAQVEESWKLGVPQKRRRQLVIGVRNDLPGYFPSDLEPAQRAFGAPVSDPARLATSDSVALKPGTPALWDAIGDLPSLNAGEGIEERDYDFALRERFLAERGAPARHYLERVLEAGIAPRLTAHRARPHNDRDLRDFARLCEGENADQALARGETMEFPYDRNVFLDRYTRQHRERLCSTIVAHLAKDGLMFIHPTQNRTLTPREAARVQSFPDWFRFPVARTHQFRLIGNAVPPLVAEAVGEEVRKFLASRETTGEETSAGTRPHAGSETGAPPTRPAAARDLERLARLDRRALRAVPPEEFLRGWHALLFLFPGLHPDNALDHGHDIEGISPDQLTLPTFEEILARRYIRSGWPVMLESLGGEAWRRFRAHEMSEEDFYCVAAQRAGLARSVR
ncbi:MAG: Cytosine-specific methyltransferase [Limisphaerales bacterium]|nr:MAG: Cytosine-specific methyltransferase [Limisphaerales bacterium]KAG0509356.1 MAG: Cytosine-specific methyltransferase [Limisphaerales bacterium]TXT52101.1 MAG: Cytosine-specific methyltransferase [Limisphaerales bacterium]